MTPTMTGAEAIAAYVKLMHDQREAVFASLRAMHDDAILWRVPPDGGWSIGENLDHSRQIYRSTLGLLRLSLRLLRPWARLRRQRPCPVEIDTVYRRPGFPMNVGWLWPPKRTPAHPVPLTVLEAALTAMHCQVEAFYSGEDPDILGNVIVWDPAIGRVNLIQALRVGLYHDEDHYDVVRRLITAFGA